MKTSVHFAELRGGGDGERVTLGVMYGDKSARIELPASDPLFDREPSEAVFRRDLHELLEALGEWEASHEEIAPHPPR